MSSTHTIALPATAVPTLYQQVCDFGNLLRSAHRTLLHGRRYRGQGALYKLHQEEHLLCLHQALLARTYRHGPYRTFTIHEPKQRTILAASLPDRVLHHALHDVVEPLVDRRFIHDSYACRRGKGTHAALDRAQRFLRTYTYHSHLDVKKYFPSIVHGTLKRALRKHVQDPDVLALFDQVIDSSAPAHPGPVDLFNPPPEPRGLPIGNLTSQFLANLYLNELDQHVKHHLKVRGYLRYMDDFVVFGNDRREMVRLEHALEAWCGQVLGLGLHRKGGVKHYREGLGFLGFKLYRSHRRLKSVGVVRYVRHHQARSRAVQQGALPPDRLRQGVESWRAHASHANTYGLFRHLDSKYHLNLVEDAPSE